VDANVASSRDALHGHLERVDVLALQQKIDHTRSVGKASIDRVCKITLQRARIVLQSIAVVLSLISRNAQRHWAEIDHHVLEGPSCDGSTSRPRWKDKLGKAWASREDNIALVGDLESVSRHGGVRTVEDGRSFKASDGSVGPFPVWLGAFVAAFVAEGLFVLPGVVAVPCKKCALAEC
jgi:hypothetical protein